MTGMAPTGLSSRPSTSISAPGTHAKGNNPRSPGDCVPRSCRARRGRRGRVDSPGPRTAAVPDTLTPARSHPGQQRSTTRLSGGSTSSTPRFAGGPSHTRASRSTGTRRPSRTVARAVPRPATRSGWGNATNASGRAATSHHCEHRGATDQHRARPRGSLGTGRAVAGLRLKLRARATRLA